MPAVDGDRLRVGVDGRVLALPSVRGLTRYTANLLRALSNRDDVELTLLCREPSEPAHLVGVDATVVALPATRELRWATRTLPAGIRSSGIDVFHAPADRGLPVLGPGPFVVTLHGSYERAAWRALHRSPRDRAWYWANELVNLVRADRVVTVSQTTADDLVARRVVRASRLRVVRPAVAPEFRADVPDAELRRVELGLPPRYLLFVGGFDANKNVEAVVRAFECAAVPDLGLVVVAEPAHRHDQLIGGWRHLLDDGRLLVLHPDAAALPAIYRGAAAVVVASWWESFSFPAAEAMASGVPLVASRTTSVPELAGTAARYFDPASTDELVAAIRAVLDDAALRRQMVETGLERTQRTWADVARETVDVYRDVVR